MIHDLVFGCKVTNQPLHAGLNEMMFRLRKEDNYMTESGETKQD